MKRLLTLAGALSCILLLCPYLLHAQSSLWGISEGSAFHLQPLQSSTPEITIAFKPDPAITGSWSRAFLQAADGNIYGLNQQFLTNESVYYRINAEGLVVLRRIPFNGSNYGMTQGQDGFIYGVITNVGKYVALIFRMRPNGTSYQEFKAGFYGFEPVTGLTAASDGRIYGTSQAGGSHGGGLMFRLKSDFTGIDVLYHFTREGGKRPREKMVEGPDGYLYGVTDNGGLYNYGAIFKIRRDGSGYQKLHDFNLVNGADPDGAMIISGNVCYGIATKGGAYRKGVFYKINTSGSGFTILHNFNGSVGEFPFGSLVQSGGALYGLCRQPGGSLNAQVFSINMNGTGLRRVAPGPTGFLSNLISVRKAYTPNVTLVSPADNMTSAPVGGLFKSKIIRVALSYRLELGEDPQFTGPAIRVFNSSSREIPVSDLRLGTTYYARVSTSLWPDYGRVTSFTTRTGESYAYVLRPADNATLVTNVNTKVIVNEVPYATVYQVELCDKSDFTGVILRQSSDGAIRSFTFPKLEFGTRYFSRVKTNVCGFGKITSFTTIPEQFPAITVKGSGSPDPSMTVLQVSPVVNASTYTVDISRTSDFRQSRTIPGKYQQQTEFVIRDLGYGQLWYARAKSDLNSTFGDATSFSTRGEIMQKKLVGVTTGGGQTNQGVLFSYHLSDKTYEKHYDYYYEYSESAQMKGDIVRTSTGYAAVSIANATGQGQVIRFSRTGDASLYDEYGPHDGSLMLASDNYLYVVHDWINNFRGGIYRIHSDGDDVYALARTIFSFRSDYQGLNPVATLLEGPDGYLYGTAPDQGAWDRGTVYRLKMDGSGFEVVHAFQGSDGAYPSNSLISGSDGFLYGCTEMGGTHNMGTVYRVRPDGSAYSVIVNFNGVNGKSPKCELLWHQGRIYGTTFAGGNANQGVVFSVTPDGATFNVLRQFDGVRGGSPQGGLTADGAVVYGMTTYGGEHGYGVMYRMYTNGSGFETLWNFSLSDGAFPTGKLLFVEDENYPPETSLNAALAREVRSPDVNVYPNPFTETFSVSVSAESPGQFHYVITDLQGNVLRRAESGAGETTLGHDLSRGIYLLRISVGERTITKRLVKQ